MPTKISEPCTQQGKVLNTTRESPETYRKIKRNIVFDKGYLITENKTSDIDFPHTLFPSQEKVLESILPKYKFKLHYLR